MTNVAIVNSDAYMDEQTAYLEVDFVAIASANYVEHGSAGLDLLEEVANGLADLFKCEVDYRET